LNSARDDRYDLGPPGLEPRPPTIRRGRLWIIAIVVTLFASLSNSLPAGQQSNAPTEYQVKAAFLFNFAKFIDWPQTTFLNSESPFFICIVGEDRFGREIDSSLSSKTIENRAVVVEHSGQVAEARHCQMVFVSSSEKQRVPQVLSGLRGTNALVVGETDGFAAAGGAIQFDLDENRVHFLINTDAADRAGLTVSSRLLSLARIIHDAPKNSGK
jgi:YfiR/HmsC-like